MRGRSTIEPTRTRATEGWHLYTNAKGVGYQAPNTAKTEACNIWEGDTGHGNATPYNHMPSAET
jgi:hypothetical protein